MLHCNVTPFLLHWKRFNARLCENKLVLATSSATVHFALLTRFCGENFTLWRTAVQWLGITSRNFTWEGQEVVQKVNSGHIQLQRQAKLLVRLFADNSTKVTIFSATFGVPFFAKCKARSTILRGFFLQNEMWFFSADIHQGWNDVYISQTCLRQILGLITKGGSKWSFTVTHTCQETCNSGANLLKCSLTLTVWGPWPGSPPDSNTCDYNLTKIQTRTMHTSFSARRAKS